MSIALPARILLAALSALHGCNIAQAQEAQPQRRQPAPARVAEQTFPAAGWQPAAASAKQRQRLPKRCRASRTKKGTLRLELQRPKDYPETIVTDATGTVLGRSNGSAVEVGKLPIAARYVVYASQPAKKRYLRLFESFVEYAKREFPTKGWQPKPQANLTLRGARQFAPKTMLESFNKPHKISFEPTSPVGSRLFILTKIEAGGKEQVASQGVTGSLRFWPHAKRGESFRIYEVDPKSRSYRVTKPMTVASSYPLGR